MRSWRQQAQDHPSREAGLCELYPAIEALQLLSVRDLDDHEAIHASLLAMGCSIGMPRPTRLALMSKVLVKRQDLIGMDVAHAAVDHVVVFSERHRHARCGEDRGRSGAARRQPFGEPSVVKPDTDYERRCLDRLCRHCNPRGLDLTRC